jgi:hypothetical protein
MLLDGICPIRNRHLDSMRNGGNREVVIFALAWDHSTSGGSSFCGLNFQAPGGMVSDPRVGRIDL